MKKIIILTLVIIVCFCFSACDGSGSGSGTSTAITDKTLTEVQPITVDGTEVSVKDFLIENLNKYIDSDRFKELQQDFRDGTGSEPEPLKVTEVIEFALEGKHTNSIDVHYLLIQADFQWGILSDNWYGSSMMLVADYDTGIVYDPTMVDESWLEDEGSKDYWTYNMLNCYFASEDYDGRTICSEEEIHRVLPKEDIEEINAALKK